MSGRFRLTQTTPQDFGCFSSLYPRWHPGSISGSMKSRRSTSARETTTGHKRGEEEAKVRSPKVPVKRAVSAGGVVFRPANGDWEVVLVGVGAGRWTIPKGLIEPDETEEQAALREVREESGLAAEIVAKLGEIDYWFHWKPESVRYHKFVHFYLMRHTGGSTGDHDAEVEDVRWFPLKEAEKRVAYDTEAQMLAKAREVLAAGVNDKE